MDADDWEHIPAHRADTAATILQRHCRLQPLELREYASRWQDLAETIGAAADDRGPADWPDPTLWCKAQECKRRARICAQLVEWVPYGWHWDYILSSDVLRRYAKAVRAALGYYPNANVTGVFRHAGGYMAYDSDQHHRAADNYLEEHPDCSETRALFSTIATAYGDGSNWRSLRNRFADAGAFQHSTTSDEKRAELETLTDAILWITRDDV